MGDTRPSHHANSSVSLFKNPWVRPKGLLESGQGFFSNFPLTPAKRLHNHPALPVKVIKPDWGEDVPNEGRVKATWLGHAVSRNGNFGTLFRAMDLNGTPGVPGPTSRTRQPISSTNASDI